MEENRKAEAAVEETKNVLDYNDYADFGVEQIRELLERGIIPDSDRLLLS